MRRRNVAYIRVAHKDDFNVYMQKEEINNYAKEHNLEIDYYYIDNGYAGTSLDRPQLKQLLKDVKDKKVTGRVIVKGYSNLCRGFENLEKIMHELLKYKVKLVSIQEDETPTFSFVQHIRQELLDEDQKIRKLAMLKFHKEKQAVITSPYRKGTSDDIKFKIQESLKYKKKGIKNIRFIYSSRQVENG